jgi:hypothetical protein
MNLRRGFVSEHAIGTAKVMFTHCTMLVSLCLPSMQVRRSEESFCILMADDRSLDAATLTAIGMKRRTKDDLTEARVNVAQSSHAKPTLTGGT